VEKAGKVGHLWWLWLFAGEDTVVYLLDPSRSHDVPQSHFDREAQGVLMVDRYSAYKAMRQVKDGTLRLAFCWAHVRRDFVRVGKGYPELKTWALQWLRRIRELYAINRERLRHAPDSAAFADADAKLRRHIALMATMLFSIFATLLLWKINPRIWLTRYFDACAAAGGKPPDDLAPFLPWNLSPARLAELQDTASSPSAGDTS